MTVTKDERIAQLEDRIAELEEALGVTAVVPRDLFPKEVIRSGACHMVSAVLGMLATRPFVHRDAIYTALYGQRDEQDQPSMQIIAVYVSHARKALALLGIHLERHWGRGWYLTEDDRRKLCGLIESHAAQRESKMACGI